MEREVVVKGLDPDAAAAAAAPGSIYDIYTTKKKFMLLFTVSICSLILPMTDTV